MARENPDSYDDAEFVADLEEKVEQFERTRIATYIDGSEVKEGDKIRYRQAPGGLLASSGEWRYGVAFKRPIVPEELARIRAFNEKQGYVLLDPDELYLKEGNRLYYIVGHQVEKVDN